ncbi:MAG: hypothetical protein OEY01_01480 [Desulfobulbaceae bacterium]|nr:hypothetical protein [Desulfobulbaceae bacterium]HIJ77963.1 hypothetical protein [Deltaproteobacteria bacterium]
MRLEYFSGIQQESDLSWVRYVSIAAVFFLSVFTFINPFPHLSTIREIGYYGACLFFGIILIREKDFSALKTPLLVPVALFTFWAFVGLFFALDVETSVHDFRSHLLEYILLFVLYVSFFKDPKMVRLVAWLLVISVSIASVHELYLWYVKMGNPWYKRITIPNHQSPTGPVGFMALYAILMSLYLFLFEKKVLLRCILLGCMLVLFITVFAVQTRSILFAMPIVFIALFWDRKKYLALFLIISICMGVITMTKFRQNPIKTNYSPRLTLNYISMLVLKDHPITGIGFGIDSFGSPEVIDHEHYRGQVPVKIKSSVQVTSQHSMWMGIATRTGVVGLLLFGVILTVFVKMCYRVIRLSNDDEKKFLGRLGLASMLFFAIYGLCNVVFMHFLETLMCVTFSIVQSAYSRTETSQQLNND